MSEEPAKTSDRPSWTRSKTMAVVTTAIVVAVAFTLVIAVVLSPSMSPLASIHDADGDEYADSVDEFPDDESEWNDLDGDGVGDNSDAFSDDAGETSDSDSDDVGDNSDAFPEDSSEWSDTDEDGVGDNTDEFPDDADECSDSDSDGVGDNSDEFPDDPTEWSDTDGDGVGDNTDSFPEDPEEDSPEVNFDADIMSDGVTLVFTSVAPEFEWEDLTVTLSSGSDTAVWEPENEDLDEWNAMTTCVYGTFDIEGTSIFLIAMDMTGDGMVSAFDGLGISPVGDSFEAGVEYRMVILYEPTQEVFEDSTFEFDLVTPTASLTEVAITDGVKVSFGAVSSDVSWTDVSIALSDGTDVVMWTNITSADLIDGVATLKNYGVGILGGLEVTMSIMDLSGNGVVNMGDYFKLTAVSFSAAVDYEIMVIYEPTDGLMASATFSG